MARATSSLPVPLSPSTSTDGSVGATRSTRRRTSSIRGLRVDDAAGRPGSLELGAQDHVLAQEPALLGRLADRGCRAPRCLRRLGQVVVGAELHGLDRGGHLLEAGHDDDLRGLREILQLAQHLDALHRWASSCRARARRARRPCRRSARPRRRRRPRPRGPCAGARAPAARAGSSRRRPPGRGSARSSAGLDTAARRGRWCPAPDARVAPRCGRRGRPRCPGRWPGRARCPARRLGGEEGSKTRGRIVLGNARAPRPSNSISTSRARAGACVTVRRPRPSMASSALLARPRNTWRSWPSLAITSGSVGVELGARAGSGRSATGGAISSSALSTSTFRSVGARRLPGSRTKWSRLPVISLQR